MSNIIKSLVHYDTADSTENRICHLPAYTKTNYIFDCFKKIGLKNEVLSASPTKGNKFVKGSIKKLDENLLLEKLPCFGRGNVFKNKFASLIFRITLLLRILFFVEKNDTLWVYHSLGLIAPIKILKKIKKFKLILEMEEIYGDVRESEKISGKEEKFSKLADAFIFPTAELNNKINKENKPVAISHGTYKVNKSTTKKFNDGKKHIVYSGTLDPRKGGVYAAIKAAEYLPEEYYMHILGTGTEENIKLVKKSIEETKGKSLCEISYDGVLRDEKYTDFLQACDIGLSTQNPSAKFNETSFPSKILAYMSSGLRVVSSKVSVVKNSKVGNFVYYYDEQTPENIAKAIMSIDLNDSYDGKSVIEKLDENFINDLKCLLEKI